MTTAYMVHFSSAALSHYQRICFLQSYIKRDMNHQYCKIHFGTVLGTFCLIIKKKWVKFYDKQLLYSKHISFETSLSNAKDSYCLLLKKCFIRDFYPDRCITEKTFQTSSCMHWTSLPLLYPQPCLRRWPWGLCSLRGDSRTTRSTVSVPAVSMCVEESMLSALIR